MDTRLQHQQEFIFRSKLPKINIPNHLPLHSYCFQNISQHSSRPCIIDGLSGHTYTYAEVELIARKVAAGLNNLGIQQGDVILLLLPNSPEFLFALLGASYRGAVTTMANPFYTSLEIVKQATASKAKLIITRVCYAHKVRMIPHVKIMCTDADRLEGCLHLSELCQADENMIPDVTIDSDDVAVLLFSSGTTGVPKGVMLTHKNLVTNLSQQLDGENPNLYLRREDVILCVLPLFHVYALNPVSLGGLRAGAAVLVMGKFEVNMLMEIADKYRVTFAPLVPPIVMAITMSPVVRNYDLSSIRMVMVGAAPLSKTLEDALRYLLPSAKIGQGYGMTEAGPVISMCLAFAKEPLEVKSGSCGTVVRNAEMKIVDLSTGDSLPSDQVGEICIRGDQIMKGYLDNPEATRTTIDAQGWLHTGDIGYIDGDNELYIVDRLKELIKYKAFQVAPAELEALLISNNNISDAAVVPMKDEVAGEVPVAFVVRTNGSKMTEEDIIQYISKQVVFYKRIHRVFFIDAIPKSPAGKILKKDLRAKLSTKSHDHHRPPVASSRNHASRI